MYYYRGIKNFWNSHGAMVKYLKEPFKKMATAKDEEFVRYMLDRAKKKEPSERSQLSSDADMKTVEEITKNLKEKAVAKKR